MGHIRDRWFHVVDGKKVPTTRHGQGKRFQARYMAPDGRERTKSFTRKTDADRFLSSVEVDKMQGNWVDPAAGDITFEAFARRWMLEQPHKRSTRDLYEARLRRHIYPVFGTMPLSAIRPSTVKAWVSQLERTYAQNTARGIHQLARTIMLAAVSDRLLARSPFVGLSLPQVWVDGARRPPTRSDIVGLVEGADRRIQAALMLMFGTGLRIGEVLGLEQEGSIDFLRKEVTVRQQLMQRGGTFWLDEPKTSESRRVVPVPAFACEAMAEHIATWPAPAMPLRWADPDSGPAREFKPIFTAQNKGGPLGRTTFDHKLALAFDALPVRPSVKITPHWLRHAYTTELLDAGIPLQAVMQWLGHRRQGITMRVYAHVGTEVADRARHVLDTLWREAEQLHRGDAQHG